MKKYCYEGPTFKLWRGSWGSTFKFWRGSWDPAFKLKEGLESHFETLRGVPGPEVLGPTFTRCLSYLSFVFSSPMWPLNLLWSLGVICTICYMLDSASFKKYFYSTLKFSTTFALNSFRWANQCKMIKRYFMVSLTSVMLMILISLDFKTIF